MDKAVFPLLLSLIARPGVEEDMHKCTRSHSAHIFLRRMPGLIEGTVEPNRNRKVLGRRNRNIQARALTLLAKLLLCHTSINWPDSYPSCRYCMTYTALLY